MRYEPIIFVIEANFIVVPYYGARSPQWGEVNSTSMAEEKSTTINPATPSTISLVTLNPQLNLLPEEPMKILLKHGISKLKVSEVVLSMYEASLDQDLEAETSV